MNNQKTGQLIARLRHEKGITQKQLGDAIGVSDKAISKWERGVGCPDISLLPELSRVFCINIEEILLGELNENDDVGGR